MRGWCRSVGRAHAGSIRAGPEGLEELREYLEAYWDDKLRLLTEAAEAEERKKRASDPE